MNFYLYFQVLTSMSRLECQPDVVVNCAALSVPCVCEMDPADALSVNVSSSLVD